MLGPSNQFNSAVKSSFHFQNDVVSTNQITVFRPAKTKREDQLEYHLTRLQFSVVSVFLKLSKVW